MYDGPWSEYRFQSVHRYITPSIFDQSERMYYPSYFIIIIVNGQLIVRGGVWNWPVR